MYGKWKNYWAPIVKTIITGCKNNKNFIHPRIHSILDEK